MKIARNKDIDEVCINRYIERNDDARFIKQMRVYELNPKIKINHMSNQHFAKIFGWNYKVVKNVISRCCAEDGSKLVIRHGLDKGRTLEFNWSLLDELISKDPILSRDRDDYYDDVNDDLTGDLNGDSTGDPQQGATYINNNNINNRKLEHKVSKQSIDDSEEDIDDIPPRVSLGRKQKKVGVWLYTSDGIQRFSVSDKDWNKFINKLRKDRDYKMMVEVDDGCYERISLNRISKYDLNLDTNHQLTPNELLNLTDEDRERMINEKLARKQGM